MIGVVVAFSGTVTSYYADVPSGATIVLLAIGVFVTLTLLAAPLAKKRARRAAGDGTRCTLEVPAARPTEDDVRV